MGTASAGASDRPVFGRRHERERYAISGLAARPLRIGPVRTEGRDDSVIARLDIDDVEFVGLGAGSKLWFVDLRHQSRGVQRSYFDEIGESGAGQLRPIV